MANVKIKYYIPIINAYDFQGRIFKKNMKWGGKVHEKIIGAKYYSLLPTDEDVYYILHHKTIEKQEKQNNYYNTI